MPRTKVIDLTPKYNLATLEKDLLFPDSIEEQVGSLIGGMRAGSRELTHGKITIAGVDEQIRLGDATAYDAGIGVFMGKDPDDDLYKFRAGDPAGTYIAWDGSGLSVVGFLEDGEAAGDVNANATTIDGGKITANSITSAQLTTGELITLTAQIKDAIITNAKIVSIEATKISTQILNAQIASIEWAKIDNVSIETADIQNAAITQAKLANLAVDTANIEDAAVTNAKIDTLSANKLTAGTIDASVITVTNLSASNLTTGTLSVGNTSQPTSIIIRRNSDNGYLTWEGGNKIWSDGSEYMGFTADGERFYFYTGATLYALFQRGSQAGFYAGIDCDGNLNVEDDLRVDGRIYLYSSDTNQYIDSDSDDIQYRSYDNHEFYKNGSVKAIIDDNIWSDGDIYGDNKYFLIDHPDGSDRLLRYSAQESPDVSLRYRGRVKFGRNGEAEIIPPSHFILITEPKGEVTVNLTSMSENHVWVKSINKNESVVVAGTAGEEAMFEIIAIRKGYLNAAVELGSNSKGKDKVLWNRRKRSVIDAKNAAIKEKEAIMKAKDKELSKDRKKVEVDLARSMEERHI